jgi:hypothetical protein
MQLALRLGAGNVCAFKEAWLAGATFLERRIRMRKKLILLTFALAATIAASMPKPAHAACYMFCCDGRCFRCCDFQCVCP